jgi:hypothetical protein
MGKISKYCCPTGKTYSFCLKMKERENLLIGTFRLSTSIKGLDPVFLGVMVGNKHCCPTEKVLLFEKEGAEKPTHRYISPIDIYKESRCCPQQHKGKKKTLAAPLKRYSYLKGTSTPSLDCISGNERKMLAS